MRSLFGVLGVSAGLLMGCQGVNATGTWNGKTFDEKGAPIESGALRMVLREEVSGVVEGELFFEGDPELIPAGALKGTRVGDTVELAGLEVKLTGGKLTASKLVGTLDYAGAAGSVEPLKVRVELAR